MDISQESDQTSQDEILVLLYYGKILECYVRESYFKTISVVGVYRAAIPSCECFASYRSLGLPFLFGFGDKLLHK